jgi:hypothetical protein
MVRTKDRLSVECGWRLDGMAVATTNLPQTINIEHLVGMVPYQLNIIDTAAKNCSLLVFL